ncbi:MAG: fibronectin type III domain-containing protein [Verrucomicrobiota bacterium]
MGGVAENGQAALTWLASSNATSYNVKRSLANGGPYSTVASVTATNVTDTGLTNGVTYYYVVSALNPAGESADSTAVALVPEPPLSLTQTTTNLTLAWPLASAGFTLQSRTNLVLGNWLNVSSPVPQIIGGEWRVTLPVSTETPATFYRLAK